MKSKITISIFAVVLILLSTATIFGPASASINAIQTSNNDKIITINGGTHLNVARIGGVYHFDDYVPGYFREDGESRKTKIFHHNIETKGESLNFFINNHAIIKGRQNLLMTMEFFFGTVTQSTSRAGSTYYHLTGFAFNMDYTVS